MPLIARRISDGAISPDFQHPTKPEILIANAVRAGFAAEQDIEVIEVSREQFEAAIEAIYGDLRREQEESAALRKTRVANAVKDIVGLRVDQLTLAQTRILVAALAYQSGALTDTLHVAPLKDWLE